jgi:endonuclease/exonuclease/phosphatase family metal-dependent hydrolase
LNQKLQLKSSRFSPHHFGHILVPNEMDFSAKDFKIIDHNKEKEISDHKPISFTISIK